MNVERRCKTRLVSILAVVALALLVTAGVATATVYAAPIIQANGDQTQARDRAQTHDC